MRGLAKLAWTFLFLLALALTGNALTYVNLDPSYGFLNFKQGAVSSGFYLPFFYAHVLLGGLILLAGFLQVSSWFRKKYLTIHRNLGRFYVFGILFFAAPGGLVMSFFVNKGPWVLTSFLLQCSLWFYFTAMAFLKIRKKDVAAHELWMWRSFSLTLAAIMLRAYIFLTSNTFDLGQSSTYGIIAWASWLPNLLLVEYFKKGILRKALNKSRQVAQ